MLHRIEIVLLDMIDLINLLEVLGSKPAAALLLCPHEKTFCMCLVLFSLVEEYYVDLNIHTNQWAHIYTCYPLYYTHLGCEHCLSRSVLHH